MSRQGLKTLYSSVYNVAFCKHNVYITFSTATFFSLLNRLWTKMDKQTRSEEIILFLCIMSLFVINDSVDLNFFLMAFSSTELRQK